MIIMTVGYLHGSGGAERQIILLSNQLALRGHDVTLCVLNENKSPYSISDNVKVLDLCDKEGTGRLRVWKRFKAFKHAVEKLCPNVIVNYNLQSAYFCLGISKNTRGKVVYSERGDPYDKEYSGILRIVRDFTVSSMNGLVFQSEGARDFFSDKVKDKSIVIHNSVNVSTEKYPIPSIREKRIVSVGRLHPQKNQRLLIKSFAIIARDFPDYCLDIYGDGALHDVLQKQIDECGLHERVHLIASRKDIFECIHNASLFVLTSDFEGMPNALMEAMALGMPCIATDCRPGGARTLIEDGVNGFVVPCRNAKVLANKMKEMLGNTSMAESMARAARRLSDTHNEQIIFDRWNAFLLRVCTRTD